MLCCSQSPKRIVRAPRSFFFSLAASAFQHATDAIPAKQANSKEEEQLVRLLGDLKREFGVPDRYKFEGRPGRE